MQAFIFPGQSSQRRGMGKELLARYPQYVSIANEIAGYDLQRLCIQDPDGLLDITLYTQVAVFVVNALHFFEQQEKGNVPDILAGHSVGEFNALHAAGVFDFGAGVALVKKRAEIMHSAGRGAMAAIIGFESHQVAGILKRHGFEGIDVANYNSRRQVVISGLCDDVAAVRRVFEAAIPNSYIPLKVSGAFHSRYMKDAGTQFSGYIEGFAFSHPSVPVVSNVTAEPYAGDDVSRLLSLQLTSPVKWMELVCYMIHQGCNYFDEMGEGRTLTGLVKSIQMEMPGRVLLQSRGQDSVEFIEL